MFLKLSPLVDAFNKISRWTARWSRLGWFTMYSHCIHVDETTILCAPAGKWKEDYAEASAAHWHVVDLRIPSLDMKARSGSCPPSDSSSWNLVLSSAYSLRASPARQGSPLCTPWSASASSLGSNWRWYLTTSVKNSGLFSALQQQT
jgi:hypothetical protein